MAQCNFCSKKGFFLRVSKNGLCDPCEELVAIAVNRHIEIIQESAELVDNSKVFKTRISRLDVILEHLDILDSEYIEKGVFLNIDTKDMRKTMNEIKYQIFDEEAYKKTDEFLRKAGLAKTLNTKINNANKALLFLKELQDDYGYLNEELGIRVMKYIHDAEYQDLLLKAEREEFKENHKKAIDKYKDVLFFLAKDDIDDNLQREIIQNIERKIEDLTSSLKK
ncbi:hypothetical protein [Sporosarcina sp. FSL K6-3508]|uniref:hypothetical protein n=1 Tax=Sporosarcina sp. FSL K6-3508 TaxID=2921557 RepID=UPI00315A78CB